MYGSAIARDSKGSRRDDSAADGRKDGHMVKNAWSLASKLKKDLLVI